ncbi:MAG TPA: putative glycoside hydrolase [Candidatus Binatia bacterium]|nr:putative glycoside hydrolase [Candidatus Binatia bacterium]
MRRSLSVAALALGLAAPASLRAADPTVTSPGNVRFTKFADSSFDSYTQNPSQATKDWMRAHYWRLVTYTPYFDSRLSWWPDAWVYKDLYAIYVDSSLASAHPEWILRDASGAKLYIPWGCSGGTCPQYAADIGNPDFRAYWLQEAATALTKGYRGLWVDDVNMLIERVSNGSGQPVVPRDPRTNAPMTQADWRRYMAEFTEAIRARFPGKEIAHNALWFVGFSDPSVQRQLLSADFLSLERGVNDSGIVRGTGPYGFETLLALVEWMHQHGRAVFFQPSATTDQGREYGLAAYFLVNPSTDTIGNSAGGTPGDWWAGYDVSLGAATGSRYVWNGVFRRDFERGIVLVNQPGSTQVTLQLGASYLDVLGRERTSVTLAGAQGAVLRRSTTTSTAPTLLDVVPVPD